MHEDRMSEDGTGSEGVAAKDSTLLLRTYKIVNGNVIPQRTIAEVKGGGPITQTHPPEKGCQKTGPIPETKRDVHQGTVVGR